MLRLCEKIENLEVRKKLEFLSINYLAKGAPINIRACDLTPQEKKWLEHQFHLGLFTTPMSYHREDRVFEPYLTNLTENWFPGESGIFFHLTDTPDFVELLPLYFTFPPTSASIARSIQQSNGLTDPLNRLFLFDVSDRAQISDFNSDLSEIEKKIEELLIAGIEQSNVYVTEEEKHKAFITLKGHCCCIERIRIGQFGVLKILPVFAHPRHFESSETLQETNPHKHAIRRFDAHQSRIRVACDDFLNLTGLRLGGVSARMNILDVLPLDEMIHSSSSEYRFHPKPYDLPIGQPIPDLLDKLNLTFDSLSNQFEGIDNSASALLGKLTIKLVERVVCFPYPPEYENVVQVILFRIKEHCNTAAFKKHSFKEFCQAIELIHAEIISLLAISMPFRVEDYQNIFQARLHTVPEGLFVKAGLCKSAMNVLSGILTSALTMHGREEVECSYAEVSYIEGSALIDKVNSNNSRPLRNSHKKVALHLTEFNHNVSRDIHSVHHQKGDVIREVETLLKTKGSEHLTVAVDCTVDYINSNKITELLDRFEKEIESGRLNFVFYWSGQKFDQLGMDVAYAAPFYIVNNGESYWDCFNRLLTHEAYQTDPLSLQWFCLVNQIIPEEMDEYRRLIFDNTRSVLQAIQFKHPVLQLSKVDFDTEFPFIDLKIIAPRQEVPGIAFKLQNLFLQTFINNQARAHVRASFGFHDANMNILPDREDGTPRHIRIEPGLDPSNQEIILEFLKKVSLLPKF